MAIFHENGQITNVRMTDHQDMTSPPILPPPVALDAIEQLQQYFGGFRRSFQLKLAPKGTPFQRKVFQALTEIPYGATLTYGQLASKLGIPGGARAVGMACAANPILILIPCHRVVGKGDLGGFSSPGGTGVKEFLLRLEGAIT